MTEPTHDERLAADHQAMQALKQASTVFDFESTGEPPDRYTIIFRGKGIRRDTSPGAEIEPLELHRCDIRLPYSYPENPPDIRWLTPAFHPNISFSGFIGLRDISLPWNKNLGLDVVCERLWDVARLAYLDLDKATNHAAKNWFAGQCTLKLPLDHRPLRDKSAPSPSNVIHYQRRGEKGTVLSSAVEPEEVFYIGENTPTPQLPQRAAAPRRTSRRDDDDVIYIGDE